MIWVAVTKLITGTCGRRTLFIDRKLKSLHRISYVTHPKHLYTNHLCTLYNITYITAEKWKRFTPSYRCYANAQFLRTFWVHTIPHLIAPLKDTYKNECFRCYYNFVCAIYVCALRDRFTGLSQIKLQAQTIGVVIKKKKYKCAMLSYDVQEQTAMNAYKS